MKPIDLDGKPFHFIGIGGIGMSALAYILADRNLPVSGSDLRATHITERLASVGATIFNSQTSNNLDCFQNQASSVPQVICSTAIAPDNQEYRAARDRGYPIYHRSDLLAALIADYHSIAVAGTHGKTTTSSLIGYLLLEAKLDPTIIIGGEVDAWQGNARSGKGELLVAEADESDGSLAKYSAKIGVITNIELDHTDRYQNLAEVVKIFQIFASKCETLIACIDCPNTQNLLATLQDNHTKVARISYSIDPDKDADYQAKNIVYKNNGTVAEIWEKGKLLGILRSPLLGKHNLSNALAAIAVARDRNLSFETISQAVFNFEGAKRRFEVRSICNNITLVDDYAHHPSEIKVTLAAGRLQIKAKSRKRLVAVFQPHRYSRAETFLAEFAAAFNDADLVIVTDIYSAGESNSNNISGAKVAAAISARHSNVLYHPSLNNLDELLSKILRSGDLVLFLGAGNLNQIVPGVINLLSARAEQKSA